MHLLVEKEKLEKKVQKSETRMEDEKHSGAEKIQEMKILLTKVNKSMKL